MWSSKSLTRVVDRTVLGVLLKDQEVLLRSERFSIDWSIMEQRHTANIPHSSMFSCV